MQKKIFEEIMSKYFPNLMKNKFIHLRISANPKQKIYEENYTSVHHNSSTKKNPKDKEKNL